MNGNPFRHQPCDCITDLSDHMTYIDRTPFDEVLEVNAVFILLDVKLAQ